MNAAPHAPPSMSMAPRLAEVLDQRTQPGQLWRAEGDKLRCLACGHRCLIASGRRGICRVRHNENGQLRVPFGYVAGVASDPVEKKPFNHVLPGADALTFGMLGCDFHCGYCQNWASTFLAAVRACLIRSDSSWREITPCKAISTSVPASQPATLVTSSLLSLTTASTRP